jgi:hypothetical protein
LSELGVKFVRTIEKLLRRNFCSSKKVMYDLNSYKEVISICDLRNHGKKSQYGMKNDLVTVIELKGSFNDPNKRDAVIGNPQSQKSVVANGHRP